MSGESVEYKINGAASDNFLQDCSADVDGLQQSLQINTSQRWSVNVRLC